MNSEQVNSPIHTQVVMSDPTISMIRHASCDEVFADDQTQLNNLLRLAVTCYAGTRLDPIGPNLPFRRISKPKSGYLIPPAVGEDLLVIGRSAASIQVDDRRVEPTVAVRPEQITHGIPLTRPAATAASAHARGIFTWTHEVRMAVIAGLAQAVRPSAGVLLVKNVREANQAIDQFGRYGVPARIVPRHYCLMQVALPIPLADYPEGWVIVPVGHKDWARGVIPAAGIVLCADAADACAGHIQSRLFFGPGQRVYGFMATNRYYSAEDVHSTYGAFGREIHHCQT
jgi:hypothetical protein